MSKEVSRKEIKRVVRQYIERMKKQVETRIGHFGDEFIDCPKCGNERTIEPGMMFGPGGWQCRECNFVFPKGVLPPSTPEEIKGYFKAKETIEEYYLE